MVAEQTTRTVDVSHQQARRRRAELLGVIHDLEQAVAAPAAGPTWREWVQRRLGRLRHQLTAHVMVTEGPDGLYAELREHAPRLDRPVADLVADHDTLLRQVEDLAGELRDPLVGEDRLREQAEQLLVHLLRHRQRGADLVYEAYATDIGGET